ncbi:type II toxin-antitoxin system RelE/ParE family toxin [Eubacteriales bacterium OttesenSCG-928-N14]|nr:type II toxin-antitoxin system RelE/ParE family toxin [Eubacteriales bacterium OttesenSCG-928-N14]
MESRYRVLITKEANEDIEDIVRYISRHLNNPDAAMDLLDAIEEIYANIARTPLMYALCDDTRLRQREYRKIPVKNHVIVYRVVEDTALVIILRAFYGGMDYMKLL